MPKITHDPTRQCCAFDKSDHRRCRLICQQGKLTCSIHKSYYTKWIQDHPPLTDAHFTKRKQEEYTFQLKNGFVILPPSYYTYLLSSNSIISYKVLTRILLEHTNFTLADYPDAIREIVTFEIHPYVHFSLEAHLERLQSLTYLFKDAKTLAIFLEFLMEYLVNSMFMTSDHIHISLVFSTILHGSLPWHYLLYSNTMATICDTTYNIFLTRYILTDQQKVFIEMILKTYFEPFLLSFHVSHSYFIRHQTNKLKEELVNVVFHPSRISRHIETYGLDILDHL